MSGVVPGFTTVMTPSTSAAGNAITHRFASRVDPSVVATPVLADDDGHDSSISATTGAGVALGVACDDRDRVLRAREHASPDVDGRDAARRDVDRLRRRGSGRRRA